MRRGCTLQTQADTLYIQPLLLQALKPQRQQLPHFGRCSMALHQHAPFALIDLPVSQMRPQWRGHQLGNSLRALLRQQCLLHQLAEHRRFFSGLFQRNRMVATLHANRYARARQICLEPALPS